MSIKLTNIFPSGKTQYRRLYSTPTIVASFDPSTVDAGVTTTLTWSTTDTTYVTISTEGITQYPANGTLNMVFNTVGNQNVTITAHGPAGSTSLVLLVVVEEPPTTYLGFGVVGGLINNYFIDMDPNRLIPINSFSN